MLRKVMHHFHLTEGTKFGDWNFNWSGVTEDQVANFKTGDIIGDRVVNGGTYQSNNGNTTINISKSYKSILYCKWAIY